MSDLNISLDKATIMICGVCNGDGKIDNEKCPYCAGKGTYGERNVDEIVDLGEF